MRVRDVDLDKRFEEVYDVFRIEEMANVTDLRALYDIYMTTTLRTSFHSYLLDAVSYRIREIEERRREREREQEYEEIRTTDKETWEQYQDIYNRIIDDMDELLTTTLTEDELQQLMALVYEALKTSRRNIPLEWLPPEKRNVALAWLDQFYWRRRGDRLFAFDVTRSIIAYFSTMYATRRFRIYAHICWYRPDAPDKYRGKSKTDRVCVTAYLSTLYGEELPNLLDPSYVDQLLRSAPSSPSWIDELEDADSITLVVMSERE